MKIYTNFILIFSLLLCFGCNNKSSHGFDMETRLKEVNLLYKEDMNSTKINTSLLDHFPTQIISLPIDQHINNDVLWGPIYYSLFEYNLSKNTLDSIETLLKDCPKYGTCDTQIVIKQKRVFQELKDSLGNSSLDNRSLCIIPFTYTSDFSDPSYSVKTEDIYTDRTTTGIKEDFEIYIIKSEPGIYYKNLEKLTSMPKGWEHGYSKGISINRKYSIINYWIIIW